MAALAKLTLGSFCCYCFHRLQVSVAVVLSLLLLLPSKASLSLEHTLTTQTILSHFLPYSPCIFSPTFLLNFSLLASIFYHVICLFDDKTLQEMYTTTNKVGSFAIYNGSFFAGKKFL